MIRYISCAFPNPFKECMTYSSESTISIGEMIKVPFGKKSVWAWVIDNNCPITLDPKRIKSIQHENPLAITLPQAHLTWITQVSQYYHLRLCDWFASTIPSPLWQDPNKIPEKYHAVISVTEEKPRTPAQCKAYNTIAQSRPRRYFSWLQEGLRESILRSLLDSGCCHEVPYTPLNQLASLSLNQQHAVDSLDQTQSFQVTCLEGQTGSGKTEVYAHLISKNLARGRAVLMLAPEIALSKQLVQRLAITLGEDPVIYHSGIKPKLRAMHWQLSTQGHPLLWLGTRSACSLPLRNLGLIIVDEEHDSSFRNQTRLRFCARDAAILKAKILDIPICLGSATPCLHTYHHAMQKRFKHLTLPSYWPVKHQIKIHDCRGIKCPDGLHPKVVDCIKKYIAEKTQILIFLNRRGYAPVTLCRTCGAQHTCVHCDSATTYHQQKNCQICHHCGRHDPPQKDCPHGHPDSMILVGYGTERIALALQELFPEQTIARMDRDVNQDDFQKQLELMQSGHPMVLVGTQLMAKGFDAPNIRLVVFLGADQALYADDFRGEEKTHQLLTQVIGRSGRRPEKTIANQVLIQTYIPHHPLIAALAQGAIQEYRQIILQQRQAQHLPPFGCLSILWLESKNEKKLQNHGQKIRQHLQQMSSAKIYGPLPARLRRRKDMYCYQVIIQTPHRSAMRQTLQHMTKISADCPKGVDLIIDRDARD